MSCLLFSQEFASKSGSVSSVGFSDLPVAQLYRRHEQRHRHSCPAYGSSGSSESICGQSALGLGGGYLIELVDAAYDYQWLCSAQLGHLRGGGLRKISQRFASLLSLPMVKARVCSAGDSRLNGALAVAQLCAGLCWGGKGRDNPNALWLCQQVRSHSRRFELAKYGLLGVDHAVGCVFEWAGGVTKVTCLTPEGQQSQGGQYQGLASPNK